jgi:hypothetical protein
MPDDTDKSVIELSEQQLRTAMQDQEHLIRWMEESGRTWLIFNGKHLASALPWPAGAESLIQVIACYRDHRATIDTGETQIIDNPITNEKVEVPVYHPETLTLTEMDRAIRWLVGQITELDPDWKLTNVPL